MTWCTCLGSVNQQEISSKYNTYMQGGRRLFLLRSSSKLLKSPISCE